MKNFLFKIKEFFNGKQLTREIDLLPTSAWIKTPNESYKLTNVGKIHPLFYITGKDEVLNMLNNSKNFIAADCGTLIPIHTILKVVLETKSLKYKISYKK